MELQSASSETLDVAEMLIAATWLVTPQDVVEYFRKPYKWEPQASTWRTSGSPLEHDEGWDFFLSRLERDSAD